MSSEEFPVLCVTEAPVTLPDASSCTLTSAVPLVPDARTCSGMSGGPGVETTAAAVVEFAQPGVLRAEKLVNMSKHNYRLEPNVSFTPDKKWVVFRSNMFGDTYAFAVEVEKAR